MQDRPDYIKIFLTEVFPKLSPAARTAILALQDSGDYLPEQIYRRAVLALRIWKEPSREGAFWLLCDDIAADFYNQLTDADGEIELPDWDEF